MTGDQRECSSIVYDTPVQHLVGRLLTLAKIPTPRCPVATDLTSSGEEVDTGGKSAAFTACHRRVRVLAHRLQLLVVLLQARGSGTLSWFIGYRL